MSDDPKETPHRPPPKRDRDDPVRIVIPDDIGRPDKGPPEDDQSEDEK